MGTITTPSKEGGDLQVTFEEEKPGKGNGLVDGGQQRLKRRGLGGEKAAHGRLALVAVEGFEVTCEGRGGAGERKKKRKHVHAGKKGQQIQKGFARRRRQETCRGGLFRGREMFERIAVAPQGGG